VTPFQTGGVYDGSEIYRSWNSSWRRKKKQSIRYTICITLASKHIIIATLTTKWFTRNVNVSSTKHQSVSHLEYVLSECENPKLRTSAEVWCICWWNKNGYIRHIGLISNSICKLFSLQGDVLQWISQVIFILCLHRSGIYNYDKLKIFFFSLNMSWMIKPETFM